MAQLPPPSRQHLKSGERLFSEALAIYRRAFLPMVATTAVGGLLTNLLIVGWVPGSILMNLLWLVVVNVPTCIVLGAVTAIGWQVHQGERVRVGLAYAVIIGVVPRLVAGYVLIGIVFAVSAFTIIGIPLGLFLLTRWALFGPAVVLEQRGMGRTLARSWHLVTGKSWRTFYMLVLAWLGMGVAQYVAVGLSLIFDRALVAVVALLTIMLGLVLPLVNTYFLLLFEDYRVAEKDDQWQLPL